MLASLHGSAAGEARELVNSTEDLLVESMGKIQ